jgi:hypothetical protein
LVKGYLTIYITHLEKALKMTKKKQVSTKENTSELSAEQKAQKAKALAQIAIRPSANAAAVISEYGKPFGEQDINQLIEELIVTMDDINKGDLQRCENMLLGQAYALQSIFMNLSRKANIQEHMKNIDAFLRLALKAQSQCRATLETLAAIKNPPVIFAKQANISSGHQQVNNGIPPTHTGKNKFSPNELLEAHDGSTTLDTGTTGKTSIDDKAMAAVV